MGKFQSTKLFDGFSTVFRQWKATGTHCRFLHGYGVSFRVWFEGELDEKLTKKTKVDTYIKDFKDSDAPQFKGKSDDKKVKMAVAAYLSKKNKK